MFWEGDSIIFTIFLSGLRPVAVCVRNVNRDHSLLDGQFIVFSLAGLFIKSL